MTDVTELAELLDEWEGRLRELGASCVEYLRPGLSRRDADNLFVAAGVHLPDDAAFMWMWHDGDRETGRHRGEEGREPCHTITTRLAGLGTGHWTGKPLDRR